MLLVDRLLDFVTDPRNVIIAAAVVGFAWLLWRAVCETLRPNRETSAAILGAHDNAYGGVPHVPLPLPDEAYGLDTAPMTPGEAEMLRRLMGLPSEIEPSDTLKRTA